MRFNHRRRSEVLGKQLQRTTRRWHHDLTFYACVSDRTRSEGKALVTTTEHNCVRLVDGSAKCWGDNYVGQIGDGTKIDRPVPVTVVGLGNDVAKIETGIQTTCALNSVGGLKCWGTNYWGQVGDGTWETRTTPVQVVGLASGVAKPGQGWNHNCAVMQSSSVKCWGADDKGQLGTGTATYVTQTPVDVIAGSSEFYDAAELASQSEYLTVSPGAAISPWIEVRNTGTTTWTPAQYGYNGKGALQGDTGYITRNVAPGGTYRFFWNRTAPTTPGVYDYGFMLRHGTQEFGPYFFVRVTVVPAKWTLMYYLAGDNELGAGMAATITNLQNQVAQARNPFVKVVALFDGQTHNDSAYYVIESSVPLASPRRN